jgi:hypothetical protein
MGSSDWLGAGAWQPTDDPAVVRVFKSEVPPMNIVGPNGPSVAAKSWQTVGSTLGAAGAAVESALAAGTATASAAATAARAASGFRQDNIGIDAPW